VSYVQFAADNLPSEGVHICRSNLLLEVLKVSSVRCVPYIQLAVDTDKLVPYTPVVDSREPTCFKDRMFLVRLPRQLKVFTLNFGRVSCRKVVGRRMQTFL
jgi:hypothetical protein